MNNPLPAIMGRVCYHPCEGACNRAVSTAVGINSVERFLGDEAIAKAGDSPTRRRPRARKCWWLGPDLRGCPPPISWRAWGTSVTIWEAGPGRRNDALRHSEVSHAARRSWTPRCSGSRLGVRSAQQPVDDLADAMSEGGFDAAFPGSWRPYRQTRLYSGRRRGQDARRACGCCARWRRREAAARPPRPGLWRRQHGAWMSRAPPSGWAPTRP